MDIGPESFASLQAFRCLRLAVQVEATTPIQLPHYQGSALRGSFGHALRRAACALRLQECKTCLLKTQCIYSYAFETPPPTDSTRLRKYPYAPHPFVINPGGWGNTSISPGTSFEFGMTLVGRAIEALPYFVYAFMRMGESGLGRGRGNFVVQRVKVLAEASNEDESIYQDGMLTIPRKPLDWTQALEAAGKLSQDQVAVHFQTPLRMRYQGDLCDEPEFHILLRNLLRRLSNLSYFHCGQELDLPFRELIELAGTVRMIHRDTRWHDWERYSSRKKESMMLGGLLGTVTYAGHLRPFLPLLVLGSWVNVGKGTSFGLGRLCFSN